MKVLLKNIYIDIDGVILTRGGVPAQHLDKFLRYILNNYCVFWLTSRCCGDSKYTVKYLSQFLLPEIVSLIERIKPTSFQVDKTEAIDFSKRFFWLDDDLFASEKNTLREHSQFDSWIEVNLIKNPDQLRDLVNYKLNLYK
ncbi:hypothetical protein A2697_05465 [Candidatus Curtissbacteria bacterium RIFCSPHIGHO2_01_FULL_41_44]|uniref:FCP1 homology domain-containing protein n=1 Tax=Candidatus Curtissbacteria bacterium RIFCSPLOWO2_01_FULL_42_50 TaxID=1797730 RepID=A0A1F5H4G4_9BACT|nr:MAG: hypothetical protein A2697_05465 [Candidatus Curtissbacteria bacterium RIFCSPHIGHO2_01_FULL_41_44]OGD93255.1 MAG: hypothetical protein A3C33_04435 [Candidatus Curtissbacteria bacterium RIFCSPHIGHO2_02_FULL_42_58]OGD96895.1 MAG: hypothetical protein A3E71_00445 [Candidatus Curtissbacteria bacterium RIFCSPHIGHO2_12_FULL_42_33]OGD98959.1 MAG: hypothetical protein A3B54_01265 [Candidatus Curtissbacteria bacterium RIFCSPLOWO2_01_FULL_42_50]OGE03503.1 MAG: hypothetical protein A3G16_02825 [Ca